MTKLREPLERLLAAFKGMMPFPLVVQAVAEGLVRDAETALATSSPTRDGPERAGCPNCGSTAPDHSFGCFRAPPKPAPDAVREALQECRPLVESFRWQGKRYQVLLAKIDAALAAPVPSPDDRCARCMPDNCAYIKGGHGRCPSPAVTAEPVARCPVCDWPMATEQAKGCVPGDCSYRPDDPAEQERIRKRRAELASPAVRGDRGT